VPCLSDEDQIQPGGGSTISWCAGMPKVVRKRTLHFMHAQRVFVRAHVPAYNTPSLSSGGVTARASALLTLPLSLPVMDGCSASLPTLGSTR